MKIAYTTQGEIQGVFSDSVSKAHEGTELLFVSSIDTTQLHNLYVDLTVNPPKTTAKRENPVVVNKTTIKADGSDTAIFSNIPSGTVCTHDGETYTVTDGMIEFTTTHDGDYDFVFELFPYITASFIITAEESKP